MKEVFAPSKFRLIYVFRINDEAHADCLKIGETSISDFNGADPFRIQPQSHILNEYARQRIEQYTRTAGIDFELLYTETAYEFNFKEIVSFNDKEVHQILLRSGVKKKEFAGAYSQGTEWFVTDLETVKRAIKAAKEGRSSLTPSEITTDQSPIVFRPEQREAIDKTLKRYKHGQKMLWNAKMRFGKTLSALQVVKEMNFAHTLILTHRPVVDSGWYEDFSKIFYDCPEYRYGSKTRGETFSSLVASARKGEVKFVYFASIQDLRGSSIVSGKFDKNEELFSYPWDFVIVDEAHEGTQTDLGKSVIDTVVKPQTKVLQLSGTPFNLLDNFKEDEIYTWDYVMEQHAKATWDDEHFGDPNPYACLPKMHIFTYNLGKLFTKYADESIAFNFREFFKTGEDGEFIHRDDVQSFLDLLVKSDPESQYPFANDEYRKIFRHTLWVVPGVKEARALKALMDEHEVFQLFKIVNVAGDGDADEESRDALEKVEKAIGNKPDETYTITLSCGRLTTGVSVKAWTGVFMLAGSYNTAASAYMQTIFRVQTPATINGRMKEDCYVFDFAPDRTLQILSTVPRISSKPGKTTDHERKKLGDFLNFCPVIAMEGSKMETLDVNRMLQQLKKAYIERVVRSGFEDSNLYNDELLKLTDVDIKEFEKLKGIIGQTKAIGTPGSIDINSQGLTEEEYAEKERLERHRKELSEEEKARLEELKKKKKVKEDAISILRGMSIRMPLLIYGADIKNEDTELTIDNFTSLVDSQSWEEFMPRGVTKQKFTQFKKYYDPEVFAAAGKRIRAMARSADKLTIEERITRLADIFATFRNPDKETVLTPWRVVNLHMGETLGGYCFYNEDYSALIEEPRYIDQGEITTEVFSPSSHLLEINSKSGLYPLYLVYNVYRRRLAEQMFAPNTLEEHLHIWDKVVEENVFVICKTPMAKSITRRTLIGFRKPKINAWAPDNLINKIKNQPDLFLKKVHDLIGKNMKINAVVGNPPYQEEGISTRKAPVYHLFYDIARSLSDKVSLITPGRFLFRAGQTPKEWMDAILKDRHFKVVKFFKKSTDVFPTVDIKGGVVISYRDEKRDFGEIGFFSEYPELISILHKVSSHKDFTKGGFAELVSSQGIYRFSNSVFENYPRVLKVQGKGTAAKITSYSFENLPEIFLDEEPDNSEDYIQMIGRSKSQRVIKWIRNDFIQEIDSLNYYKVLVPEANGTGAIGEILSTPMIGTPMIGHTDTFLTIGKFDNENEAANCLKYVRTKFARTMLGTLKATQHNPKDTWLNVPMQDFSVNSDINWKVSVEEIDKQLYDKYHLTIEERLFVETMIKAMYT